MLHCERLCLWRSAVLRHVNSPASLLRSSCTSRGAWRLFTRDGAQKPNNPRQVQINRHSCYDYPNTVRSDSLMIYSIEERRIVKVVEDGFHRCLAQLETLGSFVAAWPPYQNFTDYTSVASKITIAQLLAYPLASNGRTLSFFVRNCK